MLLMESKDILEVDMDFIGQVAGRKDTADLPAPAEENEKILGKIFKCVPCLC